MTRSTFFSRNGIVSTVSALGVVGSLIFVGIQIRQHSEATRAAAVQQLGQSWVHWNTSVATREIQAALLKVEEFDDPSKAPLVEQRIAESYVRALFANWSTSHYQYLMGVLDQPLWDGVMRDMRSCFDQSHSISRLVRWAWIRNRDLYAVTFSEFIDSTITGNAK
jgi:hypothetical protein